MPSHSALNAEPCLRGSSVRKPTYLRLIVNGLAFELLSVRACPVHGDRARFAVFGNLDPARPNDLAILPRSDVVGPVVHDFVGGGAPRQISFRRISFPVELADPNAVRRFPIFVCAAARDL